MTSKHDKKSYSEHVLAVLINNWTLTLQLQLLLSLLADTFCVCFTVRLMGAPAAVASPNLPNIPQAPLPAKPGVRPGTERSASKHRWRLGFRKMSGLFCLPSSRRSTRTQRLPWSAAWTRWRVSPLSRTASATFLMKGSTRRCTRGRLPSTRARPAAPITRRPLSSTPLPHPPPRRMKRGRAQLPSEFIRSVTPCCGEIGPRWSTLLVFFFPHLPSVHGHNPSQKLTGPLSETITLVMQHCPRRTVSHQALLTSFLHAYGLLFEPENFASDQRLCVSQCISPVPFLNEPL